MQLRPGVAAPVLHVAGLRRFPGQSGGGRADARRKDASSSPSRSRKARSTSSARSSSSERDQGHGHRPTCSRWSRPRTGRSTTPTRSRRRSKHDRGGRQQGYAFAEIEPRSSPTRRHTRSIDVTYQINGGRGSMSSASTSRQRAHARRVIRREFRLAEGDAYQHRAAAPLAAAPAQPRLLREGRRQDDAGQRARQDHHRRQRRPKSRPANSRSAPAISTADGVLGDIGLARAQPARPRPGVSANVTLAQRRQYADVSFTEPYFLGRNSRPASTSSGPRPTCSSESSFNEENKGFTLRAGYPLTENLRHTRALHAARRHDQQRRQQRLGLHPGRGRQPAHLRRRPDLQLRPARHPVPPEQRLLHQARPRLGRPGRRQPLPAPRGTERLLLPVHAERGPQPQRRRRLSSSAMAARRCTSPTASSSAATTLRGFAYGGIGPRDKDSATRWAATSTMSASAELRFPLGLPRSWAYRAPCSSMRAALWHADDTAPTYSTATCLRVSAGFGVLWRRPSARSASISPSRFSKQEKIARKADPFQLRTRF